MNEQNTHAAGQHDGVIAEIQVTEIEVVEANGVEIVDVEQIEIEIIDIEEHAKHGKKPPKAKKYRIKIDKTYYTVEVPEMTGRDLLVLAQKDPPENYMILRIMHGGESKPIGATESVSFVEPGIERFVTLPKDQTEGGYEHG